MAKDYRLAIKIEERNNAAREAESDDDYRTAIKLYEQNIKENFADDFAFERLMVIYRKQKDFDEELRVINRGIEVFEQKMNDHLQRSLARHADGRKLEQLSKAIIKKSGKKDEAHFPDPIDKWLKRKEVVEKKLE